MLSDILSWHLEGFNEEIITRLVRSRQGIGGTRKEDSLSRACLPNGWHWGGGDCSFLSLGLSSRGGAAVPSLEFEETKADNWGE